MKSQDMLVRKPVVSWMTLFSFNVAWVALWVVLLLFGFHFAGGKFAFAEDRVIYPKKTVLDLEGMSLQGEVRNPGELYFLRRQEEKMDSLLKRRKHFHREMLRDVVMGR